MSRLKSRVRQESFSSDWNQGSGATASSNRRGSAAAPENLLCEAVCVAGAKMTACTTWGSFASPTVEAVIAAAPALQERAALLQYRLDLNAVARTFRDLSAAEPEKSLLSWG